MIIWKMFIKKKEDANKKKKKRNVQDTCGWQRSENEKSSTRIIVMKERRAREGSCAHTYDRVQKNLVSVRREKKIESARMIRWKKRIMKKARIKTTRRRRRRQRWEISVGSALVHLERVRRNIAQERCTTASVLLVRKTSARARERERERERGTTREYSHTSSSSWRTRDDVRRHVAPCSSSCASFAANVTLPVIRSCRPPRLLFHKTYLS